MLAAYREGMKIIILPKENVRDIEDIPKPVRDKLEFVPVKHMDEVLKVALLPKEEKEKEEKKENEAVPAETAAAQKGE